jgi:predicted DNA-binding transcriptional regulator YafY
LRDLDYLRDMYHAPIEYDTHHRGFYYTEKNFFIKSVLLSEGELFSLSLFDRLLEQYRNTPLEEKLRAIFQKIVASMPDKITADFGFLASRTTFIPDHAGEIDPSVFQSVFTALQTNRTVRFEYRPLQKTSYLLRTVDPYHAICQKGNWYIIGYCHDKKEARMFSMARIKNAKITASKFVVPDNFKPEDFFDPNIGVWVSNRKPVAIELLFANEVGTFALEQRWHDTQTVIQNDDGTVFVSFTTTQIPEVLRWALGQGHTVKVLNPPELITLVQNEAKSIQKMYNDLL